MKMKTVNDDAQALRLNSPQCLVDNANAVTPLPPLATGEKTNISNVDLILQEVEFILNHRSSWFSFEPKKHALSELEYWELLDRVQGESLELQEFWHNKLRSIGGGATLSFEGPYAERQPDVGFRHLNPPTQKKNTPEYQYPVFIIEVACSQTSENSENVAYDYIKGSKGKIKNVVVIDIGYKKQNAPKNEDSSRLATISIWKAKTKGRDVEVQRVFDAKPFRNANGSYAKFHDVFFTYNDFTIYTQPPRPQEPFCISISSKVLFDSLVAGEQRLDAEIAWRASIESSNNLRKEPTKPATALPKRSRNEDTEESFDDTDPRLDKNYHEKKRHQHHNKSNL
ncbi:hypothetical protein BKA61DRAFT_683876 [Leptodontidium sp. MPI-SDFR-AT-0119]|nr:hypothetical protein BKA61DRAFT_683876 [Leptodontidium sp. MPI-SDFR-AT-0119]